jgi:hypothetical protein
LQDQQVWRLIVLTLQRCFCAFASYNIQLGQEDNGVIAIISWQNSRAPDKSSVVVDA